MGYLQMGVTSEGACNMPEHMKRREAVYYFRRVVPKDLQAAGHPREICRSLKTKDLSKAKEQDEFAQLYGSDDDENGLPYDQWVVERERLDREADAAFFEEERRNRTVSLGDLFEDYATASRLAVQTVKQWRAV